MERIAIQLGMFETLFLAVVGIYIGRFLRNKFSILKKYCLPASVVGGTLISIITCILYYANIVEPSFDFKTANTLFYCLFFAASGAAASMALLKKGGKLVVIFAILAAVLAFLQNALSLGLGNVLGLNPLIAVMTGSTPLTGGHGNAAAFAPRVVELGAPEAMEVAIAAATFGLISGSMIGGPFGNFMIKKHNLIGTETKLDVDIDETDNGPVLMSKSSIISAVLMLCFACGIGQIIFLAIAKLEIKSFSLPIHVCCMFGGIMLRVFLDKTKQAKAEMLEAIDSIGEFSLELFVGMSIVSMKLWQLAGLGLQLIVILVCQVIFILIFSYILTFRLLGKNYDAAIMAVGHTGFGLGAVPVSMTTMKTVCDKYSYSRLAFFVVPVIGGFISNLTNALIISWFINLAGKLAGVL